MRSSRLSSIRPTKSGVSVGRIQLLSNNEKYISVCRIQQIDREAQNTNTLLYDTVDPQADRIDQLALAATGIGSSRGFEHVTILTRQTDKMGHTLR